MFRIINCVWLHIPLYSNDVTIQCNPLNSNVPMGNRELVVITDALETDTTYIFVCKSYDSTCIPPPLGQ
jgi:hypothetical protein